MRPLLLFLAGLLQFAVHAQVPGVERVLVIGFDGLSPKGIEEANTPNIDELAARGAHSYKARAVMPTVSSPNWASMIMGAGPEQHGVLGNEWPLPMARLQPSADGPQGIFPTIFSVLREQRPDAYIAVVHDWDGFGRLFQRKMVDLIINGDLEDDTLAKAIETITTHKPTLTFIHFDHVDHNLHGHGFLTPEYIGAVEKGDAFVGDLMDTLKNAGIFDTTAVILTADHGGKDKGHGGNSLDEYIIPWIIAGPGITPSKIITTPINTYDTAVTVAHLLGLTPPEAWVGRPVLSAFQP